MTTAGNSSHPIDKNIHTWNLPTQSTGRGSKAGTIVLEEVLTKTSDMLCINHGLEEPGMKGICTRHEGQAVKSMNQL